MNDIKQLIDKYYKSDGMNLTATDKPRPAERTSNEYRKQNRLEENRKHRHLILDQLLNEIPFYLNEVQVQQIRYWIDTFNTDFKNFNRNSSNETIILAFMMIQRKKVNPRLNVERFTISRKYDLNNTKFITIQNRLIFQLMRTTQLVYNQSRYYNHNILEK